MRVRSEHPGGPTPAEASSGERVSVRAGDTILSARWFGPSTARRSVPVLVCGATGLRQSFYAAFARWLAAQGVVAMTFDYRGIGESLGVPHVRESKARKQDWGEFDMPAALEWLLDRTGAEHADIVGHSAGGQLVGLMRNHSRIRRVVAVAGSSGFVGGQPGWRGALAWSLLTVYLPVSCALLGYGAARRVGFGEDLPTGVAQQWAKWCLNPGYVANDFGHSISRHYYDEFDAPVTFVHATDDAIATRANVEDMARIFRRAPVERVELEPAALGLSHIGHVDMFRRSHAALWPRMVAPLALDADG